MNISQSINHTTADAVMNMNIFVIMLELSLHINDKNES